MTTTYTDWLINHPEGRAQDDMEADESRDEELREDCED